VFWYDPCADDLDVVVAEVAVGEVDCGVGLVFCYDSLGDYVCGVQHDFPRVVT